MGTAWLDEFLSECSDCTIDCIAFHIYDSATNIPYYQSYITNIGTKYGKPTYMTEVTFSILHSAVLLLTAS